ncbi:hypothetical protein J3T78_02565 [Staphylococcus nepalensis]|uniref:Mid2-like cell wall stress sensor domain protein n=1 Tax=Staphylococcus nepalensis TaxID=214473 RepID=A0ABS3L3Q6_9STAP|nr:hypothetical protein [Staphylococcus nepalensis]MBO1214129.1 hypothetical protein [Staphylococcus nepalensis]MBO1217378.1 hypothetical protein [Staphylococcus nepalensis]MBO1228188.1 hypothetical protein [Staphylococcus nepalensis]MBO1233720.1 hypothetical protein [Staphylococcus nepalensis]MBO1236591.1 hypothetical protein [Staphylococcus nepalensis]
MVTLFSILLILSIIFAVYNMYRYFVKPNGRNSTNLYWLIGSLLLVIIIGIVTLQIT